MLSIIKVVLSIRYLKLVRCFNQKYPKLVCSLVKGSQLNQL